MKYRIIGTTIPAVEIKFDAPGETMYTQSGGMSWMSEGISMSTNTRGGFMKGLGRMFAGESMFMATYRADAPGATIAFASTVPGQVLPIDAAENGGMICQKGAFLCAQDSVNLDVTFTKKFTSGLVGGWVENGEYPADMKSLESIVKGISYNNAVQYFGFDLDVVK